MRKRNLVALLGAASCLVAASEPVRLQPSSKWVLDYAENSCRLIRNFGEGKHQATLVLESGGPGTLSMVAIGEDLKGRRSLALNDSLDRAEGTATFLPARGYKLRGRLAESSGDHRPAIMWSGVYFGEVAKDDREALEKAKAAASKRERPPPRDLAKRAAGRTNSDQFAAGVTAIEIEARRGHPVVLETGSLGEPMRMFDQCIRDEMRGWGIDPDLEEKIVRPVWPINPQQWLSGDDYPIDMLREDKESSVKVRLLVDAAGKVTRCTTLSQVDAPEFEKVVCDAILRNGRFEPAELADGTKVPSYYTQQIMFRIAGSIARGTRLIAH
ncbi:MAG TPA: energy transducer TonB [Sphingomicrobium sp.]|nr:energy transducer TonB [Sphingomicrobium sp.]